VARPGPIWSLEFFAPRTPDGAARLRGLWADVAALAPAYVSVTCASDEGGPERTLRTVQDLRAHLGPGADIAPHLTCVGSSRESTRRLLTAYRRLDVRHLVVVRGDLPPGMRAWTGDFAHASDLVTFIRRESGDDLRLEVAAHPEFHPDAPTAAADLAAFKHKVEAGASSALTQYFYNADAYIQFVASCAQLGVKLPIVPGVMPITNFERLARFSEAAGVEIPRWLRKRAEGLSDPASLQAFGVEVVSRLCRRLLEEGAPGLHFYTMNRAEPVRTIWARLGLG